VLNKALRIADDDYADSIGGCGDCVVKCDGKCTPWCYVKLVEYWKRKAMEHDK
jgi:aerobic-type carbon monoxide dehydrogenase small subunit (CoxS/CutS family)